VVDGGVKRADEPRWSMFWIFISGRTVWGIRTVANQADTEDENEDIIYFESEFVFLVTMLTTPEVDG
jgi:hypothetical protein